jgi:steroid 5-alpha reductase family enzyme
MPMWTVLAIQGLAVVGTGAWLLWLVSLVREDASIADRFWGLGFVVLAGWYASRGDGWTGRSILLLGLTAVWGLRLSLHIHVRNRGKPEDPRYARWREETGDSWWWRSLFKVFLLQAVILWIVAAPLLAGLDGPTPDHFTLLDGIGSVLWLIGFVFEAVGDAQLAAFKRDPANRDRVLSTGLWCYTRHPNYFGDAVVWWGLFTIAASTPAGLWTAFGPALMTFLLARISGVPMLESRLRETRPGYAEYVERTSAFVPWPPKNAS